MEWVYRTPLNKDERVLEQVLRKQTSKKDYSFKILRVLSLIKFLKSRKFKNSHEIQNSIFYDKEKTKRVFDEETSKLLFKKLQKKGGKSDYPIFEKAVQSAAEWLKENDPTPISWIAGKSLEIIEIPMVLARNVFGSKLVDLAVDTTHASIETGVSGVNGAAGDIGGPVGIAAVGLFTAAAAAAGSAIALTEGDIPQATIHILNGVPGVGPAIVQGINKVEKIGPKIGKNIESLQSIPIIGDLIPDKPEFLKTEAETEAEPKAAGKRFSSRKRRRSKWVTQRRK